MEGFDPFQCCISKKKVGPERSWVGILQVQGDVDFGKRYKTLIEELPFEGKGGEKKKKIITRWRFLNGLENYVEPAIMKNMKKTEKFKKSNTFSQVVEPRDFETDERMAYYQAKHYSPWFDKLKPKNRGRVKKKLVLEQKKLTPQTPNGCLRGI